MVRPFPTEIWLEIFHGLAKEGEYDTLERCRVTCKEFAPMARECLKRGMTFKNVEDVERIKVDVSGGILRRWGGPETVWIEGGDWNDGRRPIPHLATFASRFAGRWPRVKQLCIINAVWRARDLDLDAVVRNLAAFAITHLNLRDVALPSILTLGRLLCALPRLEKLTLCEVQFTQHPLDAGAISRFHLLPHTQLESLYLDHGHDDFELRPSFVGFVDLMAAVSNRRYLVPPPNFVQASPWSTVRRLALKRATFASVTSFAHLLCALPALEALELHTQYAFAKHGFDLSNIPAHPGLPSHLAYVDLAYHSPLRLDPCSVADLVDFFIATGLSENLRRMTACLSTSSRVTPACDAALIRLVQHSQSLRHLSFELSWPVFSDTGERVDVEHSAGQYLDVSSNTLLERLLLVIDDNNGDASHLCVPVVAILSQVTSAHISMIAVVFCPAYSIRPDGQYEADLKTLLNKLPQLDAVLSRTIFKNLTNVIIQISTVHGEKERDEELAHDLRLFLPTLNALGILSTSLGDNIADWIDVRKYDEPGELPYRTLW